MMKATLRAACLAAFMGLSSAGLVAAADQLPAKAQGGPGFAHFDPAARAQKHLDRLGKNLNLKPEQQGAWQAYAAAMTQLAKERGQEMDGRRQSLRQGGADIPSPDRLDKLAEQMRKGADSLARLAGETRTFYAQLSTEQKTIFDLQARVARHQRLALHMPQGMPH